MDGKLCQSDAVHLFLLGPDGPVGCFGLVQVAAPGLAVVVSQPGAADMMWTFGDGDVRKRLLRRIAATTPVEIERLSITAIPRGHRVDGSGALATLVRPNFSFVLRST